MTFKFKESIGVPKMKEHTKQILTLRQQEIVSILKENGPLSPKMIGLKLKEPVTDRTIRNSLVLLKKLGILDSSGLSNKTLWFLRKNS